MAAMRGFRREGVLKACELCERALTLDRRFDLAAASLANDLAVLLAYGWADDPASTRARAMELANGISSRGSDNALVLAFAGNALGMVEGPQRAMPLVEQSVVLNPGSAFVWFISGMNRVRTSQLDLGVTHLESAMRLDPLSRVRVAAEFFIALSRTLQGRDEEALAILRQNMHTLPLRHVLLAILHARLGQPAKAKAALAEYRSASQAPPESVLFVYGGASEEHRQRMKEGLALALAAEQL